MTEPLNSLAVTTGACSLAYVSCHALGAEPAALLLALLGSVGATMFADSLNNLRRTYGAVMLSTLLGGYGTPATLALTDIYLRRHALEFPTQTLIFLAPFLVGALTVVLLPYLVGLVPRIPSFFPAVLRWLLDRSNKP